MICVEHLINYFFHGFQSICPPYSHTCTTRFILVSARNHFDHVRSPHSLINLTQVADSVQRCSARWKSATQRSSTDKPTILEPAVDELCQHVIGGGELPECKSSWTREELGWLDLDRGTDFDRGENLDTPAPATFCPSRQCQDV